MLRYAFTYSNPGLGDSIIFSLALLLFAGRLGDLIEQTGWVARGVLAILAVLSVFSWAIILQKSSAFGRVRSQTNKFLDIFRANRGLPDPRGLRVAAGGSPLVRVYDAGYRELEGQLGGKGQTAAARPKNVSAVGVEMRLTAADEVHKLERWMTWLATTGSISPFIGLFGTVWGVMDAFMGLGDAGAASLRVVAPGIAEALVTTAAGLFTAIPAVVAYNHYLHRIRTLAVQMDNFAMECVAKIETMYS